MSAAATCSFSWPHLSVWLELNYTAVETRQSKKNQISDLTWTGHESLGTVFNYLRIAISVEIQSTKAFHILLYPTSLKKQNLCNAVIKFLDS